MGKYDWFEGEVDEEYIEEVVKKREHQKQKADAEKQAALFVEALGPVKGYEKVAEALAQAVRDVLKK